MAKGPKNTSNDDNTKITLVTPFSDALTPVVPFQSEHWENRLNDCQRMLDRWEWVIDGILNVGSLHLIAGPSGSGKTRWLLRVIHDWSKGEPILGYMSNPKPYLYLSCDRSMAEVSKTLETLGLSDWGIAACGIEELNKQYKDYDKIQLEELPQVFPDVKVFFIEAVGWFMPTTTKGNAYAETLKYWSKIRAEYEARGLTIIGTTHCPKQKRNESYANPRDRVIGSVAQAGVASTIILFEPEEDNRSLINIDILPRNSANLHLLYEMDSNGAMKFIRDKSAEDTNKVLNISDARYKAHGPAATLRTYLQSCVLGATMHTSTFKEELKEYSANIQGSYLYRWLKGQVEDGTLLKLAGGFYQYVKPMSTANAIEDNGT